MPALTTARQRLWLLLLLYTHQPVQSASLWRRFSLLETQPDQKACSLEDKPVSNNSIGLRTRAMDNWEGWILTYYVRECTRRIY